MVGFFFYKQLKIQANHMQIFIRIMSFTFFLSLILPSLSCNASKSAAKEIRENVYMVELAIELDGAFLKELLIEEKADKITRASRSKNLWTFALKATAAQHIEILQKIKNTPNVLNVSLANMDSINAESKSNGMKKVKPIIK